jgi:class 3 adenylate cyclase
VGDTGARLLVVDDNKVNRLLLGRNVQLLGHHVKAADSGRLALDLLRSEPFDLLLLDIGMPDMDGFQVLEELVTDPALRDLPVIVTSALEGIANVVRCIELGAEDYLQKPVNPVLLRARIDASLEKKRLRDQLKALVSRFAAAEVAEDLQQSGFSLGGRAVRATVLFCDIRGFTALVDASSPEDIIELLNAWYTLMFDAITSHGGVVNQMLGDGLMVLFGAPHPLEDPCRNAVEAALEMIDMVAEYSAERVRLGKPGIEIGIGIATGPVIAGYTGTQDRATYTCIGETVNLAARLEQHTKVAARALLVDRATREALGDELHARSLGPVQLKGKAAPVEVFSVP